MSRLGDSIKRKAWSFFTGNQLSFGPGAVTQLAHVIHRRKAQRVLLVSDPVLDKNGMVNLVREVIETTQAETATFCDGEVEPSTNTVARLVELAQEHKPDIIVALGGGSNMDLSKAALAAHTHECDPESLFGFDQVPGSIGCLVCVPTTAGTGSEVTHAAIIKNSRTNAKAGILSQHIRPEVAIVDPNLTLSCPPKVTAESGIDALTHAIETYLVRNFYAFEDNLQHGLPYEGNHPLGDLYAEKAIELIGKNIKPAWGKPDVLAARSAMAYAATLAGAAFSSCGLSLAHALEYPIGAKYKCSHGAGNGIVLPAIMEFWCQTRLARVAKVARLLEIPDADRMDDQLAAEAAIEWVKDLRATIELPTCLTDVGGSAEDIGELAKVGMSLQRLVDLSPCPVTVEDAKGILRKSL